ncbi:MAG TPA: TolC family protein [Gemmatimonadales bacterium]|nr:TolC family protein [Gemmatimonadales bacterium]
MCGHVCSFRVASRSARTAAALVFLALVGVESPGAQVRPDSLTLQSVYAQLEAGTPRVAAALAAARAAEARIAPARRPPDPELQLGLMNRRLPGLGLDDVLGMNQIQLMQMIPIAGKLGLAAQVERARSAAAGARADDVRWEERSRAAMAFYELYETDQSIAVAGETQRLLRDLVKTTATMYAVGEARQPDVLRAQVELARMTEEIVRMEAMRAGAAARLNAVLDRPADAAVASPVLPSFPSELPSRDSLERLALAHRPMLRAGGEDVNAADAAQRLAGREIWPDLTLGVQYGWRPMEEGTDHMLSLMLGFRLPIWAGSRQLAMRRETRAMRDMASAELAAMTATTRGRVGELEAEVHRDRTLLQLYRTTVLPQAGVMVGSALSAYRVGGVDFMTLLDARMSENRYRQELARLEGELGRAIAELEMLVGTDLLTSPPPPPSPPGEAR